MFLIWFVSFTNGIKRIRDKTFCFDVWLGPNPRTWHTLCIHGAGCNSEELCGIRMSEFSPLLLKKREMIGSLSQNLFCQLQSKGEWLTILESLKRKKQTNVLLRASINKQVCSYELKQPNKGALISLKGYIYIYIYGVCLRFLPQTSSGGTCLPSLSLPVRVRLLPRGDLGLYLYLYLFYCVCIFNSCRICARILYDVLVYSIPIGYVHIFWLV